MTNLGQLLYSHGSQYLCHQNWRRKVGPVKQSAVLSWVSDKTLKLKSVRIAYFPTPELDLRHGKKVIDPLEAGAQD
jgi:hypothetical protein